MRLFRGLRTPDIPPSYKIRDNLRPLNNGRSNMLLSSVVVLVAALPVAVLGGEFPVYDGVIGGAPINVAAKEKDSETTAGNVASRAGGLRYLENSGVCGRTPLPTLLPVYVLITRQKPPPACTQLQAMQTSPPHSTCGSGSLQLATTPTPHHSQSG